MLNAIGMFFYNFFVGFFKFLLMIIDFDSLEVTATQAGDNPIYGYFILIFMAGAFVLFSTAIVLQTLWGFAKYLYKKEMQWRRKQRMTTQPYMSARVIKAN